MTRHVNPNSIFVVELVSSILAVIVFSFIFQYFDVNGHRLNTRTVKVVKYRFHIN